jgi:hypothetical protein
MQTPHEISFAKGQHLIMVHAAGLVASPPRLYSSRGNISHHQQQGFQAVGVNAGVDGTGYGELPDGCTVRGRAASLTEIVAVMLLLLLLLLLALLAHQNCRACCCLSWCLAFRACE